MKNEKIAHIEEKVLHFIEVNPERNFGITEIVARFADDKTLPVEVKIATLNLVRAGKIYMNRSWCVGKN